MERDAKAFLGFVVVLVAAIAYRYLPRWWARAPFVGPEVVKQRLDAGYDVIILDVRTSGEFSGRRGHLPGAINVPLGKLKGRLRAGELELASLKDLPLYVHCMDELRAARAARTLGSVGFSDISVIKGGFLGWRRRKFPVEH